MHVHHGISPNADRWSEFCDALCASRDIKLDIVNVTLRNIGDKGMEATAREARYAALFGEGADFVLTAHHLCDQAETVLLQLIRGAGIKGLSAMPASNAPNGRRIVRPLLTESASEIQTYAESRGLSWIVDESNLDQRFARNFVRREILPGIEARFPGAIASMARSACHLAESQILLDDLAAIDLMPIRVAGGLEVAGLRRLSSVRAKNALRAYFSEQGLAMPQTSFLEEMLRQAVTVRADGAFKFEIGEFQVRIFRGVLLLAPLLGKIDSNFERRWDGVPVWRLPELGGILQLSEVVGDGVSSMKVTGSPLSVRLRKGGERMRIAKSRPTRSLKNLLRESGTPFWIRERLPLLYCGQDLAFVPGIGLSCEWLASPGERGLRPKWIELAKPV
jgi:tRNA(Ile)-lysidine synthase